MTCDACGREYVITGELRADGTRVPNAWVEILIEMLCQRGKLAPVLDEPGRLKLRGSTCAYCEHSP